MATQDAPESTEILLLVAGLAHDFRTKLRSLNTIRHLLGEELEDHPAVVDDLLARQERIVTQMNRRIEDLLKVSRSGLSRANLEPVQGLGVAQQVVHSLWGTSDAVQVEGAEESLVLADKVLLWSVFENLIGNALKHGAGKVRVMVEEEADRMKFRVCDEGPGISLEESARLLLPHERRFSKNVSTSGLGLTIVLMSLRRMDGQLGFECGHPSFTLIKSPNC